MNAPQRFDGSARPPDPSLVDYIFFGHEQQVRQPVGRDRVWKPSARALGPLRHRLDRRRQDLREAAPLEAAFGVRKLEVGGASRVAARGGARGGGDLLRDLFGGYTAVTWRRLGGYAVVKRRRHTCSVSLSSIIERIQPPHS